jgi:hypothetical protein
MSISPALSIPVPALALVPAIVIEAIVIAVMLKLGPARALRTALKADVSSAFIVLVLLIAATILCALVGDRMAVPVVGLLDRWTISVAVIALPPGFLIAWWIKHSIIRRAAPYVQPQRVLQATGAAHLLSSFAMVAAAWALLSQSPVHGSYSVRTRVQDSLGGTMSTRLAVENFWLQNGRFPASAADLPEGLSTFAQDVLSLETGGRIVLRVSAPTFRELDGKQILWTPTTIEGRLLWKCNAPDIEPTYLPANCRD